MDFRMRRVFLDVLGCPKNEYDSKVLETVLRRKGYEIVNTIEDADTVFLNTCGFIDEAKMESIERIFEYIKTGKRLIVHGCFVQRYFLQLSKEIPEVFAFFGLVSPNDMIDELESKRGKIRMRMEDPVILYDEEPFYKDRKSYAYVKIGDGCDRNCTFCSIPNFKKKHRSRKVKDIVRDVVEYIKAGKKEIILVDQDCTQYKDGECKLKDLLKILNNLKGEFWIRVMYLNPDFLDYETIDTILNTSKVVPYFDIPLQHVSNKVLKAMGRLKNKDQLVDLLEYIKKDERAIVRSSFIIGFPNEDDEDFEELMEFIQTGKVDRMGFFIYSQEEGTRAFDMGKRDEDEVKSRYNIATEISFNIMCKKQERMLNKNLRVLIDGFDEDAGMIFGRSYMDAPEIDTVIYIENDFTSNGKVESRFVEVEVNKIYGLDLGGRVIEYSKFDNSF